MHYDSARTSWVLARLSFMSLIVQILAFGAGALLGLAPLLASPGLLLFVLCPLLGGCLGYLAAAMASVWFDWAHQMLAAQDHLCRAETGRAACQRSR